MANIENLFVNSLSCAAFTAPASSISNAAIVANAGISASKLQHRHQPTYSQVSTATVVSDRKAVHVVQGLTASANAIKACSKTVCVGAATITVDLLKNGTTILSAPITLDSSSVAYTVQSGTVTSPSLAVGDVLEVVVVATAGGGTVGTGIFVNVQVDEAGN